jgi:hypothetical protein
MPSVGTSAFTRRLASSIAVKAVDPDVDNPEETLKIEARKLWHLWRLWVNPNVYWRAALVATGLAFCVTTVLGIVGLFLPWRDEQCRPGVLLILLFISTGTATATIAQARYRVQSWIPT